MYDPRQQSYTKTEYDTVNIHYDALRAEIATLREELTCEECEQSLADPETGVTALCMMCWNVMVTKLRAEIDRLTAENKAKDKLLQKVLSYGEEGLTIDETFVNEIEQALEKS